MSKPVPRQKELTCIRYFPAQPGSRAVFMAEARNKKEVRQIRELFDMVGQLAQVVPISHGPVMSYAVQVHGDAELFGKIEWLLKTQFTFSMVERNFSDVTFQLVRSLCSDSAGEMAELPECGICASVDPFPTRATVELKSGQALHAAYCARCSGRYAEVDPETAIRSLLARDRRGLRVPPGTPVVQMPDMVEERPVLDTDVLARTG